MFRIVINKKNHPNALVVIKNKVGPIPRDFASFSVSAILQQLKGIDPRGAQTG